MFKRLLLILVLVVCLAAQARAITLVGGISLEGAHADYTAYNITVEVSSNGSTGGGSLGYHIPSTSTYFITNTLNWAPPVTWETGKVADVTLTYENGGKTYVGAGTVSFPNTSFGIVDMLEALEAPVGTVPLTISREANTDDIKLTWNEGKYGTIDIYFLTGTGTGEFSADTGWQSFKPGATGGQATDASQSNGLGDAEKYYKALKQGIVAGNSHIDGGTNIFQAPAVGKFNILINGDQSKVSWTAISVPFKTATSSINNIFGDQLIASNVPGDADQIWRWAGSGWTGSEYLSTTGWKTLGGAIAHRFGYGYFVRVPNKPGRADKTITLIGEVFTGDFKASTDFAENVGVNDWTLIGNPFPVAKALNDADFGVAYANIVPGDADQVLHWTGTGYSDWMFLKSANNWLVMQGMSGFQLEAGKSYFYRRNKKAPGGGFDWTYNPFQ